MDISVYTYVHVYLHTHTCKLNKNNNVLSGKKGNNYVEDNDIDDDADNESKKKKKKSTGCFLEFGIEKRIDGSADGDDRDDQNNNDISVVLSIQKPYVVIHLIRLIGE